MSRGDTKSAMVRFKNRYLVAMVSASEEQMAVLGTKDIFTMLKTSIVENFGEFGAGMTSSLQVQSFDRTSGVCIVRAGTDAHRMVRACLTLLPSCGPKGNPLSVTVQAVTGCDRTLKRAAMEAYARGYGHAGLDETTIADRLSEKLAELGVVER